LRAAILAGTALSLACGMRPAEARAQDAVGEFYRGKTVYILVGVNVGAAYDLQARLLARHLRAHLPGQPSIVVQNMIGAGGIKMANYLYKIAPQDGTYLGMLGNTLPASQTVGAAGIEFDALNYKWIGAISPIVLTMAAWSSKGVKTIEDARRTETIAAASTKGAITYTFPAMLNAFLGTKFKIVTGYEGLSDMSLALERREADAVASSWSGWKTTKPLWLKEKKLDILIQTEPKTDELKGIPSVEDLAKTDDDRRVIGIIDSGAKLGFPLVAAPGTPPERVAALRGAFEAAMADPAFLKEAQTMSLEVNPVKGAALEGIVRRLHDTPANLVARAKPIIGN
jgi:tripartite-type tricarboxylate transporter receptor subunit TctC